MISGLGHLITIVPTLPVVPSSSEDCSVDTDVGFSSVVAAGDGKGIVGPKRLLLDIWW